jgi:monofunctional biosynthetic peptidoglycan transglycosylase
MAFHPLPQTAAFRWLWRLVLVLVALLVLPYLLTLLYLVVPPVSTPMLWRWATLQRVDRSYVPLERISPVLPQSVLVAEDARFCSHHGVDWQGLRDAMEDAEDGDEPRGASTITQQTVKNLFLWPGRSYIRKAMEMPLAIWMDLVMPKRRIMEIYLNIAEWGPNGTFGAQAAARRSFEKPAATLNAREAALLAAALPNPIRRNTRQPSAGLRRLAGLYEGRAARAGGLDDCVRARHNS